VRILLSVFIVTLFFSSCKKDKFSLLWTVLNTNVSGTLYSISVLNDTLIAYGGETYGLGNAVKFNMNGEVFGSDSVGPKAIYGSYFINNQKGKWCDYSGSIFSTEDGGNTWWNLQTAAWIPLQDIHTNCGWSIAVGGIGSKNGIIQTNIDTTWQWNEYRYENELKAVAILDSFTAFVVGYGVVIKTTDRGQTWNPLNIDGDIFKDIQFVNNETGYILGYSGLMYKTTNGGNDWNKIKLNKARIMNKGFYNDLFFADKHLGFICGNNGVILKTEDGGSTWQEADRHFAADLHAIWYDKLNNTGFACGSNGALIQFSY
jgi:photosystem II stability/assembly factor-like uncharacterized protein